MTEDGSDDVPHKGDEYIHDDGTTEIVFTTEEGRVLTVREYTSTDRFADAVAMATYRGINDDVATLPEADAFVPDRPDGADRADDE